ncbi:MAG: purine-nucleoside phosphorylase [Clostridia bacterium]|nr:purine-nucleoside phosphorylase [Clostridia bacterium]
MYEKALESAEYIKNTSNMSFEIGIILGTGLGAIVEAMENRVYIAYENIPNFPKSTVKGHEGKLCLGTLNGKKTLAMQGRFHYYEGYTMKEVAYPIYVMKLLGIKKLIITNSCGGINKDFEPGTLMIVDDFINLMGSNPLIGENDERFGVRFPDMTEPYKKYLIDIAENTGKRAGINYKHGVYAGFMGPYYETAAEIRAYGMMGADAIGMSTVPETIAANYLGIDCLGIACITNMATGIQKVKHSHERVVQTAQKASVDFSRWILDIFKEV